MEHSRDLRPAPGETGRDRYDPVSQALHWATAALVLASFALALWPELVKGSSALHKSLGLALLFVVPLRLGWRLAAGRGGARPGSKGGAPAAKAVHAVLYAMLLAVPVLGWLHLNSKGIGVSMFGLHLPALADADRELALALLRAKWWLSYGLLGAIGLHAAAALAHHYLLRDGVLASMVPRGSGERPAAMRDAVGGRRGREGRPDAAEPAERPPRAPWVQPNQRAAPAATNADAATASTAHSSAATASAAQPWAPRRRRCLSARVPEGSKAEAWRTTFISRPIVVFHLRSMRFMDQTAQHLFLRHTSIITLHLRY